MFSDVSVLNISPKDIGGEITGVIGLPEFGTTFVRNILKIALPKSVNDLIAISRLSHGTGV
jgi:DNA polymerase-3 subunit alpha (Gram-positive type)